MPRTALACCILIALAAPVEGAQEVAVTACGQGVLNGQVGILMADLDCPSSFVCTLACAVPPCPPYAPTISCRTTADCPLPSSDGCVLPPGGDYVAGVRAASGARVDLNGHTISGAFHGIIARASGLIVSRIKVVGPGTITGSDEAIVADKVHVADLTLAGNEIGIVATRAVVKNVSLVENDVALFIREKVHAKWVTASGNLYAVLSYRRASVSESTLTPNVWDIATVLRPRVGKTTCDRSTQLVLTSKPGIYEPGPAWGVCASD